MAHLFRREPSGEIGDEGEEPVTIVFDGGTSMVKAGFAGDDAPRAVFPHIVKRPRHAGVMVGMAQKDAYVGDEAATRGHWSRTLKEHFPMKYGIVDSWDDMEKIYHHTFYNELRINPEDSAILISERVTNPKQHREKTAQIIFETFDFPGMYLANTCALSFYATGRTTGVMLDSGAVTQSVAIYEGHALRNSVQSVDFGGAERTTYLQQCLAENGYSLTTRAEREIVRDIKEKLCYVAEDYECALAQNIKKVEYELPDGNVISISEEAFKCGELLFNPILCGKTYDGIHQMIVKSIERSGLNRMDRMELCNNIVISGGNVTCYNQQHDAIFKERLKKEINGRISRNDEKIVNGFLRTENGSGYKDVMNCVVKYSTPIIECRVIAPPERKYMAWIGGSIMASLSSFHFDCISKQEYEEYGAKIVHRKCFEGLALHAPGNINRLIQKGCVRAYSFEKCC
eukprot:703374_1